MEVYGTKLATLSSEMWGSGGTSNFNGNTAPTNVGGTTVTIGGLPAFNRLRQSRQVNAQVPSGVGTGPQPVVVTRWADRAWRTPSR